MTFLQTPLSVKERQKGIFLAQWKKHTNKNPIICSENNCSQQQGLDQGPPQLFSL